MTWKYMKHVTLTCREVVWPSFDPKETLSSRLVLRAAHYFLVLTLGGYVVLGLWIRGTVSSALASPLLAGFAGTTLLHAMLKDLRRRKDRVWGEYPSYTEVGLQAMAAGLIFGSIVIQVCD